MTPEEVARLWRAGPLEFASKRTPILQHIDSLQADLTQSELAIRAKMTCIDEQVQEIKDLQEEINELNDLCNHKDERAAKLLEQIKKLQAALIKERFWTIWRKGKHADVNAATELAKKQLRAEIPDIFDS